MTQLVVINTSNIFTNRRCHIVERGRLLVLINNQVYAQCCDHGVEPSLGRSNLCHHNTHLVKSCRRHWKVLLIADFTCFINLMDTSVQELKHLLRGGQGIKSTDCPRKLITVGEPVVTGASSIAEDVLCLQSIRPNLITL